MSRQLHLGLNTPSLGTYKSAWQREVIDPNGMATGEWYVRLAQLAEEGLFDAFFLADAPALDPGWESSAMTRLDPVIVTGENADRFTGRDPGNAIGRFVTAAEVADVVAFLASPRSVSIDGDAVHVGGGGLGTVNY